MVFLFMTLIVLVIITIVISVIRYNDNVRTYEESEYFSVTGKPYGAVRHNSGRYGEYLIFNRLKNLDGNKKFLFNCYVPINKYKATEIDIILIHTSGIYVFESKNYSGWIFGKESERMWTQSLRGGSKERFYNPLMQNNTHIKYLKRFLPEVADYAFYSMIVFGDNCSLMKIFLTTNCHRILNLRQINYEMRETVNRQMLSDEKIEEIYQRLYPLTQVPEGFHESHINTIHNENNAQVDIPMSICQYQDYNSVDMQTDKRETDLFEVKKFCKLCGAKMVVRVAKRGENQGRKFWGCSNYPKCKNIRNID